ncbi:Transcription factor DIVARICATA [Acorus calamus]|uniref:Transcription factor MYBS1 n=1 Tax=Acorus calamus TaxID=4465 RepID=A0AAV9EHL0_ACOCL|nr:Transcription factor DIVARICATA [Acorus calamus]
MMKWEMEMEILSPPSMYLPSSNWFLPQSKSSSIWTTQENKLFENALAIHDKETPDRWHKVAAMIPGKSAEDVRRHYHSLEMDVSNIEAGLVPIGYSPSSFTLEWVDDHGEGFCGFREPCGPNGKRSIGARSDHERKKGVPWTEEEHRLFLLGLKKYGKGDWRNISRNFVVSRTPTQVASHAQKYFIRLSSGGKDKRRSSIHDITTVNLVDQGPTSPSQSSSVTTVQPVSGGTPSIGMQEQFSLFFDSNRATSEGGNMFSTSPYGVNSYGMKSSLNQHQRGPLQESMAGSHQNLVFQLQSSQHYPHG